MENPFVVKQNKFYLCMRFDFKEVSYLYDKEVRNLPDFDILFLLLSAPVYLQNSNVIIRSH